jgi:hypothetical protein
MEIISGSIAMHCFHVCRSDRDAAQYRIPWDSQKLLECVPSRGVDLLRVVDAGGSPAWAMGRDRFPAVPLTATQAAIFSHIDGHRTTGECLARAGIHGQSPAALLVTVQNLLRLLWRTGYGIVRFPSRR